MGWADGVGALVDLVLPARCGGCETPGVPWCAECDARLARATRQPELVRPPTDPGVPVVAAGAYESVLRRAVLSVKEDGRRDLVAPLAAALRSSVLTSLVGRVGLGASGGLARLDVQDLAVVPAPSSRASRRVRGDTPLHLLARQALAGPELLSRVDLEWAPVLRHGRAVRDQAGLSRAGRRDNTDHAFTVSTSGGRRLKDRPVLLVDDVVTTGATLAECVRVVTACGGKPVRAAVVAATPSRVERSLTGRVT